MTYALPVTLSAHRRMAIVLGILGALVLIPMMLWPTPGRAQAAPDLGEWRCRLCPFARGTEAAVTTGTAWVSDDAARFGDGSGYDEQGIYLDASGEGRFLGATQRLAWRVEDLGLDSRALNLTGDRNGGLTYTFAYRELPHYVFDTTETVFRNGGNGVLTLPGGWIRTPQTTQMTALSDSLTPIVIGSQREVADVGIRLRPHPAMQVFVDYNRQQQAGTALSGGSFFNTASLLPRPIDQATDEIDVGVRLRNDHGSVGLTYRGSFFDNTLQSIRWQNPFSATPGADIGEIAAAPDNSFQGVSVDGAYRFGEQTALTFSAGMGHGEQDAALLPYTANAQLAGTALPRPTLDGAVDVSHIALAATTNVWSGLHLRATYRYDRRDNTTPVALWQRVITDTFNTSAMETNPAYDFDRERLSLDARARFSRKFELSAGYDYRSTDRPGQEVAGQTEQGGWAGLKLRLADRFDLTVRRGTARRDIDAYDTTIASAYLQNPLLAKYNLAYRFRRYADLQLTASGTARPYTLSFRSLYADDAYSQSRIGLTRDRNRRLSADFGWTFSRHLSLYSSVSDERILARLSGSEAFTVPDWESMHTDRFRTYAIGMKLAQIPARFDVLIDASVADSTTAIQIASGTDDGAFPELRSALDTVRLTALYHRSDRLSIQFQLRLERLDTEDWALEGVEPATIPELLSMGADPFNYDVAVVAVGARYRLRAGAD